MLSCKTGMTSWHNNKNFIQFSFGCKLGRLLQLQPPVSLLSLRKVREENTGNIPLYGRKHINTTICVIRQKEPESLQLRRIFNVVSEEIQSMKSLSHTRRLTEHKLHQNYSHGRFPELTHPIRALRGHSGSLMCHKFTFLKHRARAECLLVQFRH